MAEVPHLVSVSNGIPELIGNVSFKVHASPQEVTQLSNCNSTRRRSHCRVVANSEITHFQGNGILFCGKARALLPHCQFGRMGIVFDARNIFKDRMRAGWRADGRDEVGSQR
jgi:hypothetical protein